jgi:hypothetical protein
MAEVTNLRGYQEVNRVMEWLPNSPPGFDPTFVRSLHSRLEHGMGLTDKQLTAIRNIIIKFRVDGEPIRFFRRA